MPSIRMRKVEDEFKAAKFFVFLIMPSASDVLVALRKGCFKLKPEQSYLWIPVSVGGGVPFLRFTLLLSLNTLHIFYFDKAFISSGFQYSFLVEWDAFVI